MDLQHYHGIIDLGFLSYKIMSGNRYTLVRDFLRNWLLINESKDNDRKVLYPDYKSRRLERRKDPVKLATHLQVIELRNTIAGDPELITISIPGLEADDVVAALVVLDPEVTPTVAVDKDLQFLTRFSALSGARFYIDPVPPLNLLDAKVPYKAAYMGEYDYGQVYYFLLVQAMIGDKSDSIPRLLSSNGAEAARTWRGLFRNFHGEPLDYERISAKLYKHFGDDFIRNLRLVTMPYYTARDVPFHKSPERFIESLIHETYWDPKSWTQLEEKILSAIAEKKAQAEADLDWDLSSIGKRTFSVTTEIESVFVEPTRKQRSFVEQLDALGLDR